MSAPIIIQTSNGPVYISTSGVSSASPSASVKSKDTLSLFDFLQLVGTNSKENKQATFDSEATTALVNQTYFLGVAGLLNFIAEKYKQTVQYANNVNALTTIYNGSVIGLNAAMDNYNAALGPLNDHISDMNDAIQTINGISSPTPADIATYNSAVTTYNNYLTATGNPALQQYATISNGVYNTPINYLNTVVVPSINQSIDELGFDIPPQAPVTPSTAPAGATPPLASQSNYAGIPIALISPASYTSLDHLDLLPPAPPTVDVVTTYFTPYAKSYFETLAATQSKLSGFDESVAALNFFIKQGFTLDPTKNGAFVANDQAPALSVSGSGNTDAPLALGLGTSSPSVTRALSSAVFAALTTKDRVPLPPQVYDQVNALAASLLPRLGLSAGLSVVKLLGESLKSLPKDSPVLDVATAAALTEAIIKNAGDQLPTKDAIIALLKQVPGLTETEIQDLAKKAVAGQNISILLFGALQAGLALKNPNLVSDLLSASLKEPVTQSVTIPVETPEVASSTTSSKTKDAILNDQKNADILRSDIAAGRIRSESVAQSQNTSASVNAVNVNQTPQPVDNETVVQNYNSVNDFLNDQQNADILIADIKASLVRNSDLNNEQATSTANQAVTNTQNNLPPNSNQQALQQVLAQSLINLGVNNSQAEFFAINASLYANPQNSVANNANLTPQELANQILASVNAVTASDVANILPKTAIDRWVASLTDPAIPNSWVNLMRDQVQQLRDANNEAVNIAVENQRKEFLKPTQDLAFFLTSVILTPANNIVDSYMTGIMYRNGISDKWAQPPLSIQV